MTITLTNPYVYTITMSDITVTWNDDKGHLIGNKQLNLQKATVGAVTIWTGNISKQSTYTIPTTATLPPGPTVITFYFNQSYDVPEITDSVLINVSTPGCVGTPISTGQ